MQACSPDVAVGKLYDVLRAAADAAERNSSHNMGVINMKHNATVVV
jgi:hypothetical protein